MKLKDKTAAWMPETILEGVLRAATDENVILVGGQALGVWLAHYNLATAGNTALITRDVDFLANDAGDFGVVKKFAAAIGGTAELAQGAWTALVGVAYRMLSEQEYVSVDVLHRIWGVEREAARKMAARITTPSGITFSILHPVHLLESKAKNLHGLPEKRASDQLESSMRQVRLAIEVARCYLSEQAQAIRQAAGDDAEFTRRLLASFNYISKLAQMDFSVKNAERFNIHLADALPLHLVPRESPFWKHEWSHLRERLSSDYAAFCASRAAAGPSA